jgi:hypothetical protein
VRASSVGGGPFPVGQRVGGQFALSLALPALNGMVVADSTATLIIVSLPV